MAYPRATDFIGKPLPALNRDSRRLHLESLHGWPVTDSPMPTRRRQFCAWRGRRYNAWFTSRHVRQ